jgi:hypothetical protein
MILRKQLWEQILLQKQQEESTLQAMIAHHQSMGKQEQSFIS